MLLKRLLLLSMSAPGLCVQPNDADFMEQVDGDAYPLDYHEKVAWTYDEADITYGPAAWYLQSTGYKKCANGKRQSPVDIKGKLKVSVAAHDLDLSLREPMAIFFNNGRSIQVDWDSEDNILRMRSRNGSSVYRLKSVEMRSPSEHTVKGQRFAGELQFQFARMAQAERNNIVEAGRESTNHQHYLDQIYLAVLLKRGNIPNPFLAQMFDQPLPAPESPGTPSGGRFTWPVDPNLGIPQSQSYMTYEGSQTTPPCSEVVKWIVFAESLPISNTQLDMYKERFPKGTARPIQPLNDRRIVYTPE